MGNPRPVSLEALRHKFRDFDKLDVYEDVAQAFCHETSRNFVVRFGPHHAEIALDLEPAELQDLPLLPSDEQFPIRWINFWSTSDQEDAIDRIGCHYGFTRRLRASITNWDRYRRVGISRRKPPPKTSHDGVRFRKAAGDPELGLPGDRGQLAKEMTEKLPPHDDTPISEEEGAYFQLVQSSMNYITVDHGSQFTCIGANWPHLWPGYKADDRIVPPKHWVWLTLCMTGTSVDTVISINEAPNLEAPSLETPDLLGRLKELAYTRHNTLAVLQQLSSIGIERNKHNALSLRSIREPLGRQAKAPARSSTETPPDMVGQVGASNLFYYLFEDTLAVVPVLDHSKEKLEGLTHRILHGSRMHKRGDPDIIPELHKLGKDLRLLQHLFESYKTLIGTLLTSTDRDTPQGVKLEQQACDRFRRLGDRLQLLMLNTIRECLDEKKELSSTYFNLTAQKDSQATARLTESATLLAKLSVFFLPISFMTSYFSVEIPGMTDGYTTNTYWISFGVIAALSFLSLFFFSRLLMVLTLRLDSLADRVNNSVARCLTSRKARKGKDADE